MRALKTVKFTWIFVENRPSSLGLAIDPKLTKCCGPRQRFFIKDLTLLTAKTFWETATVLSEYWGDCKARFSCILMVVVKRV